MDLSDLRRDFALKTLDENDVLPDPYAQFEVWFQEAVESKALEPNAMNLSTVGKDMKPSSRTVLLKQVKAEGFIFFTNYESRKARQIEENPYGALTFVWNELERQIRIEGLIKKISPKDSDAYFERRPQASKLGAWASPQSGWIPNRKYLEDLMKEFENEFKDKEVKRPDNWGGYVLKPDLIEFWQGRPNRLHDRIQYTLKRGLWNIERLAP